MKNIVREVTLCPSDGAQGVVQKKKKIYIQINFLWFSGFCVEVDVFFFIKIKIIGINRVNSEDMLNYILP